MFFNKKIRELEHEVERLEQLVKSHEVAYNELTEFYDKKRKELEDVAREQPMHVDFRAMGAFSVERILYNNLPTTVIGYTLSKKSDGSYSTEVREWYLHCSDKVHKDVAKQFNEYIENRKVMF